MDSAHWLFLPDDAIDDLEIMSELSMDQITRLRSFLDTSEFRPKYDFFVQVAALLGIRDEAAAKLCTFINYVQRRRVKHEKNGEEATEELMRFLKSVPKKPTYEKAAPILSRIQEKKGAFAELFSDLPGHDFSQKVQGLQSGPVPHLYSFRAYCDLRPVYDAEANEIVKMFPVITLHLVTHSSGTDETRELIVQLVEEDLADIANQLERLRKKLSKLKAPSDSLRPEGKEVSNE